MCRANTLMAAEVAVRGGVLEVGKVQKLSDGVPAGDGDRYDVTPDVKRFLVISEGEDQARRSPADTGAELDGGTEEVSDPNLAL